MSKKYAKILKKGAKNMQFSKNVEVKAKNGSTKSLNTLLEMPNVPYDYKFIAGNTDVVDNKITLPLYLAMFCILSSTLKRSKFTEIITDKSSFTSILNDILPRLIEVWYSC